MHLMVDFIHTNLPIPKKWAPKKNLTDISMNCMIFSPKMIEIFIDLIFDETFDRPYVHCGA